MGRTFGIYARISLDRREGEGVARQLADCRDLAATHKLTVVDEYVDNDLSAFRAMRRPEWERLVADLRAGTIGGLIAYHPDRLYRRLPDLEDLIEAVESAGARVVTVKASDIDLATASGRMNARILASVARHESERIGERVERAKRDRAAKGLPPGGGVRAFGYGPDKLSVVPAEADAIRSAAAAVIAGESLYATANRLNEAGWSTTGGKPWDVTSLRRVLTSPRVAGLRSYHGQVIGDAAWPAIIDRDTWDEIVAICASRRRGKGPRGSWLLSGLIACYRCDRPLYGSSGRSNSYVCSPGPRRGCGGAAVSVPAADRAVVDFVEAILADPVFADELQAFQSGGDVLDRVTAEERLVTLAERWAEGEISDAEYQAARRVLVRKLDAQPTPVRAPRVDVVGLWRGGTVPSRRAVIETLVRTPIRLLPPGPPPGERLVLAVRAD